MLPHLTSCSIWKTIPKNLLIASTPIQKSRPILKKSFGKFATPSRKATALIFTEALIHGTLAWTADHERKALLYKYSPSHSSWAKEYYESGEYVNPTEQLKRILAAPSVGGRPTPLKFLLDKENRQ